MLPALLFLSFSSFWEFNDAEFDAKLADSLTHPIFAVCHTDYCPHCIGLPEALRSYAASLGDSTNVVFTLINCQRTDACQRLNTRGVPSFRFLRGSNPRYWISTNERGLPGWSEFLEKVNGAASRKVDSAADRIEPFPGSTAFQLALADSGPVLAQYRRAAESLRMFGCTFSYSYESVSRPVLTAFMSDECNASINPQSEEEIARFMTENKFAPTHEYDAGEFEGRDRNRALGLLVSEGHPSERHLQVLEGLAKAHCREARFGWVSTSQVDVVEAFGMVAQDAPFFGVLSDGAGVNATSKKRIADVARDGLVEEVIAGRVRIGGKRGDVGKATTAVVAAYGVAAFWGRLLYVGMRSGDTAKAD
jgi:hypothetical protein